MKRTTPTSARSFRVPSELGGEEGQRDGWGDPPEEGGTEEDPRDDLADHLRLPDTSRETAAQSGGDDHDDDLREQRAEGGRGAGIECRGGRRSGRASLLEALPMAEDGDDRTDEDQDQNRIGKESPPHDPSIVTDASTAR
ncbi:MAG TPA: hypothetical protein VII09_09685, partial [Opitutaceae bacterium]